MIRGLLSTTRTYRPLVRSTPNLGITNPLAAKVRFYSEVNDAMDDYERKIFDMLKLEFNPANLEVRDVSGGCGSMFAILVESEKFKGVPMIKQHRLVNEALKDEISKWHGLQLRTKSA